MSAPFSLLQSLFDLRRFADSAAEVIELRPSDFTFPNNLDLGHARAVDGENPLHTDAIGQTAHRERLIDAAVLLCNDRAFENLKAFSGALFDFDVHFHRVADVEAERVFPDILLGKLFENIHVLLPFRTRHIHSRQFKACKAPAEECFLSVLYARKFYDIISYPIVNCKRFSPDIQIILKKSPPLQGQREQALRP